MDLNSQTAKRIEKIRERRVKFGTCLLYWGTVDDHRHTCKLTKGHLVKVHRCNCGSTTKVKEIK